MRPQAFDPGPAAAPIRNTLPSQVTASMTATRQRGPRGVGFIRTATGQTCLYGTETQAPPPAQATIQQPAPNPNPNPPASTNSGGSGKP